MFGYQMEYKLAPSSVPYAIEDQDATATLVLSANHTSKRYNRQVTDTTVVHFKMPCS